MARVEQQALLLIPVGHVAETCGYWGIPSNEWLTLAIADSRYSRKDMLASKVPLFTQQSACNVRDVPECEKGSASMANIRNLAVSDLGNSRNDV